MGPSQIWLPTLLLVTALFLHLHYADAQIERTMRHWRHREEGVCSGSSNGRAVVEGRDRYEDLRMIYQNCTRVFGNVEITYLNSEIVGNRSLDFLDDIEEVKGYILIYMTGDIPRISFKKLKVIWGDNFFDEIGALYVQKATNLTVLSMPSLRSIDKGVVHVGNHHLCHMQYTVNADEILNFDRKRYLPDKSSTKLRIKECALHPKVTCHPSCNGACWGPRKEDCQSLYRSMCPSKVCESRQCYADPESNQTRCCHSQCVAGCTGPFASDCNFCTNFMQCKDQGLPTQDCRCVEQCTSMRKYNPKTGQVEVNPDGYYSVDNRHCEKECPGGRLIQDDVCVEHCGPGMYYNPNKGDKICRKCDGLCPKSCKFEETLTSDNIKNLHNCTEIEGFLRMNLETFSDEIVGPNNRTRHGLRAEELSVLKSVRFISEYLYLAADDANVRSLDFLENLEIIEGRSMFGGRQSLVISNNHNLQHLGLRKLKKIEKGDVIISMNSDLCFADSLNWKEIVTGINNTATITKIRGKDMCILENKKCHESCDPAFGCWGPSNGDCRKCLKWQQDGHCVDKCSARGFYEDNTTMTCVRCYIECDTCKGPEPTDCLTCRWFKLMRKPGSSSVEFDDDQAVEEDKIKPVSHLLDKDTTMDMLENTLPPSEQPSKYTQLTCVPECPSTRFYIQNGECKRCHRSCYEMGCTGGSNIPGQGGCNKCKYAQIGATGGNTTGGAVQRCLFNSDKEHSNQVCLNNDLLDHFVQASTHPDVEEFECAPCDDECSTCKSKGISRLNNQCKCKNFVAYSVGHKTPAGVVIRKAEERCVSHCNAHQWGMFLDNETIEADVAGVCRFCSPLCLKIGEGPFCSGVSDSECFKCAQDAFSYRDGDSLLCVKTCEEIDKYTYHKEKTCNKVDYEKRDRLHRAALYIIIALFLLTVLIIGLFLYRRQKRLSKELEQEKVANNPEMPELIPMDLNGPKRDTQKMMLIAKQNLSRSAKQLGSGAFGVVYAGCWMPLSKSGKPTKVPVAIKVVRDPSGRAQSEMLDEAMKMTMLRHENLLRIVGVCLSADDLQLVTLLRPLGNLREFLQKHRGKLSGKELLQYSYQIASGMKYLSDQRVVHRDLAARNVLVKNIQHVEITDFGLAKLIDIGADSVQVGEGKVAIKWLALEALEKQVYNTATDVWAFGVTVWEILTYGESPYTNMTPMAIKDFLLNGNRLEQPSNCNLELYKYLIDCWLPNPDSRPTFAVLKENFYKCCRAPWYFVNDTDKQATFELDNCSQRGLIEEILDETDFEDPQNYFESEPNTPGCANTGDVFNPMGIRRMDSLGSQRYAQDPTTGRKEFGMADDNYLIPNSHVAEIGATMYTPVVVDESGNSSLVESLGYYNEVKQGAEYVNDTQAMKKSQRNSRDDRLSMIEEDEDVVIEKESCL